MRLHAIVADLEGAGRAIVAGATLVQFRGDGSTAELVAAGRGLRGLGTPFVVASDLEAALELGADGVHLDSAAATEVAAARARGLLVGRSVTTRTEALAADADYLAAAVNLLHPAGPPPGAPAPAGGLSELAAICRAATVPVVATGELDAAAAAACVRAGAAGVALPAAAIDPGIREALDAALGRR